VEIEDSRGIRISLDRPAQRIISLAPHLTENLFAIGAGERLVGVTSFSDYPPEAANIEVIGSYKDFDIERIVELGPDLVVGWLSGNPVEAVAKLERLGVPVFLSEPRDPPDVAREIRLLGALTGLEPDAKRVSDRFMKTVSALSGKFARRSRVSVFYQVWSDPLITLNGDHLVSKLIDGCGGVNIFDELAPLAPRVSIESVIERNPEAIITGGTGAESPNEFNAWKRFPFLIAVQRDNLFHVNADLLQRHTTRLAQGMADLCEQIDRARARRAN
jgi:iron complex transport system substrate-binding protein